MYKWLTIIAAAFVLTACASAVDRASPKGTESAGCLQGEVNGSVTNSAGSARSVWFPSWLREVLKENPQNAEQIAGMINAMCPQAG